MLALSLASRPPLAHPPYVDPVHINSSLAVAVYAVVPAWVHALSTQLSNILAQPGQSSEAKIAKQLLDDYICMPALVKKALVLKDEDLVQYLGPNATDVRRGQDLFSAVDDYRSSGDAALALERSIKSFQEALKGMRRRLLLLSR